MAAAFRAMGGLYTGIVDNLKTMCEQPMGIIAGGVSLFAGAFFLVWGIYKCYNILIGLEPEPFLPFFRDLAIKLIIFSLVCFNATAGGEDFKNYITKPFLTLGDSLTQDIMEGVNTGSCKAGSGGNSGGSGEGITYNLFADMDCRIANIIDQLDKADYRPLTQEEIEEKNKLEQEMNRCFVVRQRDENGNIITREDASIDEVFDPSSGKMRDGFELVSNGEANCPHKGSFGKANAKINDAAELGFWEKFQRWLQMMIVLLGFIMLGFAMFVVIISNYLFLQVCLAVAPLFVFFLAFEKTKSWFNHWLNTTMGYFFAYPCVVLIVGGLMGIFGNLGTLADAEGLYTQTWAGTFQMFLLCWIYSKLMGQVGALASNLFGGENSSTNHFQRPIQGLKNTAKGAAAAALIGTKRTRQGYQDRKTGKWVAGRYGGALGTITRRFRSNNTADNGGNNSGNSSN